MIYVIADDLTGATDTGVQLSKQGYNTVVSIADVSEKIVSSQKKDEKIDVFVIDSESRDLSVSEARNRLREILKDLKFKKDDIIYKKIDSTLRGSIGVEIDQIMKKLERDICIFTPAFPSNNRIITGGYLIVRDEPLGASEYYNGELDPGDASYIPSLLQRQTELSIGRIDLKEVIKGKETILKDIKRLYSQGKKIIVLDAINDRHLNDILLSSSQFEGSVLYAGSAGLANFLSEIYEAKGKFTPGFKNKKESFVIVGGSRNKIVESQLNYLKKKMDIFELNIDVKQIFSGGKEILKEYLRDVEKAIKENRHLILRTDPIYKKEEFIKEITLKKKIAFRELEVVIRDFLGKLTAMIVKKFFIKNIIITGGDTAIGVCKALDINSLKIQDEILPGIPLSTGRTYNYNNLKLITKAGGFGENDTLYKLVNKLKDYNQLEVGRVNTRNR